MAGISKWQEIATPLQKALGLATTQEDLFHVEHNCLQSSI
jgi:hypothetical protein